MIRTCSKIVDRSQQPTARQMEEQTVQQENDLTNNPFRQLESAEHCEQLEELQGRLNLQKQEHVEAPTPPSTPVNSDNAATVVIKQQDKLQKLAEPIVTTAGAPQEQPVESHIPASEEKEVCEEKKKEIPTTGENHLFKNSIESLYNLARYIWEGIDGASV